MERNIMVKINHQCHFIIVINQNNILILFGAFLQFQFNKPTYSSLKTSFIINYYESPIYSRECLRYLTNNAN